MMEVDLFTRAGELVTKVVILPYLIPAEVIAWGERIFVRREDGKYYEGFVALPIKTVEKTRQDRPGEPQTCPRRAEGPHFDVEGDDRWTFENWKFTDPDEAAKFNQAEADRKNAKDKGNNSTTHANLRYWLWPGPGPKPRTCDYCGCINPEDALRLKKEFKFETSSTTKGYKVYIEPPGYGMEQLNSMTNMQAGVDPVECFSKNKVQSIYPPLKAYSPHFTAEQWQELIS